MVTLPAQTWAGSILSLYCKLYIYIYIYIFCRFIFVTTNLNKLDDNEQQMIAEGWFPIYDDDDQTLIY